MKLRIVLVLAAFLLAGSGPAAAKFISHSLTIDGPGMASPATIREQRSINRMYSAILVGPQRIRADRPQSRGPAYQLEYGFVVSDANGGRVETVRQTLYPFAAGGPVVFTPRRQRIDMSYGPVRFAHGWFEVPGRILHKLEQAGLPDTPPQPDPAPAAPARLNPAPSGWWWMLALAALAMGAGAVKVRRRRAA
jgi:hypothetical protein